MKTWILSLLAERKGLIGKKNVFFLNCCQEVFKLLSKCSCLNKSLISPTYCSQSISACRMLYLDEPSLKIIFFTSEEPRSMCSFLQKDQGSWECRKTLNICSKESIFFIGLK